MLLLVYLKYSKKKIDNKNKISLNYTIKGKEGIVKYHVLNDKRRVLLKDTSNSISLWDITEAKKLEDFGVVSLEDKINELSEMVYIAPWFTLDTNGTVI